MKGMTPELYHGNYVRDAAGRLQPRAGLKDCVSVYGSVGPFDINTVQPAVLQTIGITPEMVAADSPAASCHPFSKFLGDSPARPVRRPWFRQVDHRRRPYDLHASIHRATSCRAGTILGHDAHCQRALQIPQGRTTPTIEVLRWYDSN